MKRSEIGTSVILLALLLCARIATAAQSEEKELADLLNIVQQETDVATKTRLNSDYVPGIVTVLEGDELEALGVRTAGEALGLVPGMEAVGTDRGSTSVIVRGLDFPFNAGNTQILLNGVPVARQDGGFTTAALLIPVEQIDRIEVIRGPGSVVYGDFAFMGLVNIITRKQGTRMLLREETPHPTTTGGIRVGSKAGAPFTYSLNVSALRSTNIAAPAPVIDATEQRTFAIANIAFGGFSLTGQSVHRNYSPPVAANHVHETTWDAEAKYDRELRRGLNAEVRLTHLHNDISEPVDILSGGLTKLDATLTWSGFRRQSWLIGADYSRSGLDDAFHTPPPPPGQLPGAPVLLARGVTRRVEGAVLQDQIDVNDALTLTVGGRYDHYSDLDSRFTPRISAVLRINDRHIVKAQYAEGFRPPTFFELYQPPPPGFAARYPFETNATEELNYVYRNSGRVGRVTLFHSMLSDMIRPGGVVVQGDAWAQGGELEWSQELGSRLKAGANLSYAETFDPRVPGGGGANQVSSKYLGNATLLYHATPNLVVGARLNYIGARIAGKGYSTTDITISRQDLFLPGLGIRAGIKNGLDSDITFLTSRPTGVVSTSHWPGRSAWVELSWKE
jgi:outer membrane receptor for ferrienterochelin and colicins